jgi:FkbM family methyltransferase
MKLIKKIINSFLKIFNLKLIKIVDQFSNSYRLSLAFKEKKIDYVFDIGANEGQFAQELRYYGFKNKIISFEPLIEEHKKLVLNSSKDSKWNVYRRIAIGNKNSQNVINVSKNSVSSSILNINKTHIDNAPDSKFVDQQIIEEKKLEDIFYELDIKESNLFIKIDTQGYETQVLEGAEKIIKRFKGILVEVSLTELYENQKTWLYIIQKIESLGFKIWSIDRGFTNKNNGRSLQADLVFFKE